MYNKYFYSTSIDRGLKSAEYRDEDIDSYMFRIINLHNSNTDLDALGGLRKIYRDINLKNISRLKNSEDSLKIALTVVEDIYGHLPDGVQQVDEETGEVTTSPASSEDGESSQESGDSTSTGDSDETAETSNTSSDDLETLPKTIKTRLDKAIERQKDFINGDVKKKMITKKDNKSIQAIEASGTTLVGEGWTGTGTQTKCIVVKNLTKTLIESNHFRCASSHNLADYNRSGQDNERYYGTRYNFVEEGMRLGSILGKKLQVRNEERSLKYTRKDTGRIDKRLIAELGFGNSNVFSQTFVEKFQKVNVHISVDASSSMSGENWNKAMTSAVAVLKAASMTRNIDASLSIRATHSNYNEADLPLIVMAYDSKRDKIQKVTNLFGSLRPSGTTPEGLCFEAIMKDLINVAGDDKSYFINYSDGQPYYGNSDIYYSGYDACKHTAKQVKKMKNNGVEVLSYFMSESGENDYCADAFKTMYGPDSEFINPVNMMAVAKTMNDKFLTK